MGPAAGATALAAVLAGRFAATDFLAFERFLDMRFAAISFSFR
jgi:hypothetical protein